MIDYFESEINAREKKNYLMKLNVFFCVSIGVYMPAIAASLQSLGASIRRYAQIIKRNVCMHK